MDNFDLKKYLAEGRLLKEEKYSGAIIRKGTSDKAKEDTKIVRQALKDKGIKFTNRGEFGMDFKDADLAQIKKIIADAKVGEFIVSRDVNESKLLKENEEQGYTLYTTNVEYDNGKTGYMYQLVNSEDKEENEIGFDQLYFDDEDNRLEMGVDFKDFDQGSYQEEEVDAEEAIKIYKSLAEGKLLKEDLTITGEYEGEPVINSGDELEEYLIDIMSQAIGAKDFARKVAFGLTDETSSLSLEDQRKLIQFYLDNKQHFGSQGKSSPLPSSDYEKVVDGLRSRKIPSRVKLEDSGKINIELGFDFPDSLAGKVFDMLDELGVEADIMAETTGGVDVESERIAGGPRRDYRREDRDDGDGQDEEWYSESVDESESFFTGHVDQIAQAEFGMDYDQLGPGEKEWVRDEIDNMTFEGQVNEVSTHLSEAKTPEELIKVSDELEKFINDISDDIDQEDLDKLSDVLTTVRGNIKNMLKK